MWRSKMYIRAHEGLGQVPTPSPTPQFFPGSLFQRIQSALAGGQWYLALTLAVLSGDRDVNRLTSMIFFARHPKRGGRKLEPTEPNFQQLRREWLDIRDRLVRPFLEKQKVSQPIIPNGSVKT